MDILWQDSVGSFLDPSSVDAASRSALFPDGDGGAPWYGVADAGASAAADGLLWDAAGHSQAADVSGTAGAAPDLGGTGWQPIGSPGLDSGIQWTDPGSNTPLWHINDGGLSQATVSAGLFAAEGLWGATAGPAGSGGLNLLWQSSIEQTYGFTPPSAVDSMVSQPLNALGTGGGAGQPPLTLPGSGDWQSLPGNFAAGGFASIPPSQLVWDPSGGAGALLGQGTVPIGGPMAPSGAATVPFGLGPSSGSLVFGSTHA
jgi:hypothetical protein